MCGFGLQRSFGRNTAISGKVVGKNVLATIRKVIWDMISTLFLATVAVEPTFVAFH